MESVAGMKSFRAFLKGTPGEHLITLYLDLLEVCSCQDQLRQHQLLRGVLQCYLWSKVKKSLPLDIQQQLLCFLHHSKKMSHEILINVDRTVTVVNGVLDAVVGRLQLYWYRRYVIHKALIRCQLRSQEMFGQLCNACQSVISNDNFLFHIEEHARQCHCCAISRLVPYVRIMEEARENQTSSGKDGTTQTMTVMGSFECKIHLPRALVDEAPSTVYKSEVRVISAALISDQFAGSPFATYLQQRSKTLTVNCLIFWQRALALLQSCIISQLLNPLVFGNESNILVLSVGSQSETSFEERTQSLLDMFIKNEAECDFGLSASLRHQLCHLLPLGYGKQYLVEAQEYAFKILKRQWSKYAARDQDCFWASVKVCSCQVFQLCKYQTVYAC
jgi:hypothetical protein